MARLKFDSMSSGDYIERKKDGAKLLVEDVMEDTRKVLVIDLSTSEEKELSASTIERFYTTSEAPAKEVEKIELTEMEVQLLLDIQKDNFYESDVDSVIWTDVFLDETASIDSKKARGVLSSLVKKGLILMGAETIQYSDLGIAQLELLEKEETKPVEEKEEKEEPKGPKVRRPSRKTPRPKAVPAKAEEVVEEDVPAEKGKEEAQIEESKTKKPVSLKSDAILALSNKLQEAISAVYTDSVRVVTETYIGYRRKYVFLELFEMKRTLYINVRTSSMTEEDIAKLTKVYPKSYKWVLDGKFVIKSEEDIETAMELIEKSFHAITLK